MILDLHVHTDLSEDAKPTVVEYVRWVKDMQEQYTIHGFVLTEHRHYSLSRNPVLAELSRETGLLILQGVELETDYGHILIYGVTPQFLERVNISERLRGKEVAQAALETGAVAIPAHPSRPMLGCGTAVRQLPGVRIIEQLNGANDRSENHQAEAIVKNLDLLGIGGSDAHFVTDFGLCMTHFDRNFSTEREFVAELLLGDYRPIYLEETRHA